MHRTRAGKRIELTDRDIAIFRLLCQYRYLRSTYIHVFVGGASETRFKERLGDLFHEGYLDRPRQQWEFADARHRPAVHEIGAGAEHVFRELGDLSGDARTFPGGAGHRQFLHALMICEVLASLDLSIRDIPGLRLIGWQEILSRAPDTVRLSPTPFRIPVPSGGYLVPDGLFGIEYAAGETKTYRFFALEADRGTMPIFRTNSNQTSYLGKLTAYREIIEQRLYKARLGLPNLFVLTVTTNLTRLIGITRLSAETGASPFFLFKASESLTTPAPELLIEPWERAGLLPLSIDR
jgi:hypothetical protein